MDIGLAIKIIRKKRGISQEKLYENFCSRKQISRIENNKSLPSLEMILHICEVLNISLDEIIELAKKVKNNEDIASNI